ncbi:alpha/beta hydrolase [Paenibacillus sp. VTT E-133280]|uniref:Alpha/beta hydrolase n=1 Tax=Paenibacillus odorifer TaxID=189426 RepID=A0A1R0ZP85_9BACL|nr:MULTISPECIES: alpha/beta hydrolase [Paenibacillus]6TJ2_A Chain A, Alpha/beta hydrolase [Paenibacillus sp. VTT E-133280]6TJ2_B Chain B, Alpha/beta hydrolase [Paenibacillus sp. VTT E-133280]6TJ2_C Chain C, Alpha/beta hydrolase [Paenibacillus sp. VTT E-133280]OME74456.1 alpha/beta hydrolase [Paenibacillus odorifer]OZQ66764.1 alpha/beta hydrolase [Paenibacillus sp. VTT E-133280]
MKSIHIKIVLALCISIFTIMGLQPLNQHSTVAAANHKSSTKQTPLTFVLIHGSWATAGFWDETASELRKLGHTVYTPEYAGHGADKNNNVTHEQITKSVVDYIKQKDLKDFILLGHSFGGSVIQTVSQQVPDRIKRIVFFDAFAPLDGQSVADQFPAESLKSFEQLRDASGNNTITLPFPLFRDTFVNTASLAQAQAFYKQAPPEPATPLFEKLDLKKFYSLQIPKSYLYLTEDTAIPQGPYGFHPTQSSHLGVFRFIEGKGDHMTTVRTEPKMMAELMVKAGRD